LTTGSATGANSLFAAFAVRGVTMPLAFIWMI
jgi:hypothetical protein